MKSIKLTFLAAIMLSSATMFGQVTIPNNVPTLGNYVGFSVGSIYSLPIRNDGDVPIEFFTGTNLAAPPRMFIRGNGNVGIGTAVPPARLGIYMNDLSEPFSSVGLSVLNEYNGVSGSSIAARFFNAGLAPTNIGVTSQIDGITHANAHLAGDFFVRTSGNVIKGVNTFVIPNSIVSSTNSLTVGVDALVSLGAFVTSSEMYGVRGIATGGATINNVGIYGEAPSFSGITPTNLAGAFVGSVYTTGSYLPSDANFKEAIESISNATELLSGLNAVQYTYTEGTRIHAPTGLQYGFISQEVENVLPDLVGDINIPALVNHEGTTLEEGVTVKAMRYNDIIALLVAGFNEQQAEMEAKQAEIETLESKLAELQAQMTEVVKSVENALLHGSLSPQSNPEKGASGNTLGQNVPNPFTDQTRVDFSLTHQAQVRLEVSDAQGRIIDVLIDGHLSDGLHSIMINGNKYTPGLYYYSLYANGELLTKKMIKR